jgi:4-diphosphocytidyl-2-C-methyl-D-erythritol kinase
VISAGWPAPAKLNLFLHVVGRRADGYHELQTVFQLLDYGDRLDFRVRDDGVIQRLAGPADVPPEQDLALRAARLLAGVSGHAPGVDLWLEKRIPQQGGLGGGSSDAATVLVALNRLWGLDFPVERLAELGRSLGADVPVFVQGQSAWAEGIGERLTPLALPERWYAVVCPGVAVATASVFQAPELTRNSPVITIADFLAAGGRNDCTSVVVARQPEVGRALAWLARHGPARMTGTGSCVFVACAAEVDAERALFGLPSGWQGFIARGVDRSPLHARLAAERTTTGA